MKSSDNIIPLPSAEKIKAEAASWLVVLDREELSAADLAAFNKWCAQSEQHRHAFTQMQTTWRDLAALEELKDIAQTPPAEAPMCRRGIQRRTVLGMAASIAGLSLVGGMYLLNPQIGGGWHQQHMYSTAVGEQRLVKLSDGSRVQLNTNTAIEVSFAARNRSVRLVRGEAFFAVATDPRRPFLVHAAENLIRVVGTAFTVRLHTASDLEIVVEEGRVQLTALAAPQDFPALADLEKNQTPVAELTAGQNALVNKKVERIEQLPQADLRRKLSWRQGLLAYAGDPLHAVIEDVSRYTNMRIEVADSRLANMPVGGYFRVGEVEALFDSLELTFGLNVQRVGPQHVILSAGP